MKHGLPVWNRIALAAVSGTALVVCPQAQAQSASGNEVMLKEVVVTATRRTEDMQKAALSVSVLSGEMIEEKGVFDLYMVQYAAPSVTISHFGSANEFNIRGIGRTQVDIDVPSGVVIYRDGAPTIAGYFNTEPYFDIESIEVLRGPQGTFVGKNASGGAVFVNTNDPELGEFAATVEAGVGNNDMWDVSGIVNVPLGETAALRMSYKHIGSDDFYDSITGDFTGDPGERDLNSYRVALKVEPNDQFSALLKVDYHDLDFGGNVVTSPGFPIYSPEQNGDIAYKDESLRIVADLKFKLGNGVTLSSMSAYQQLDSVNNLDLSASLPVFYQFKSNFDVDILSQEFNLISAEDQKVRWVTGLFYFEQTATIPDWTQDGFTFTGNVFGGGDATGRDFPWFTTPWDKDEEEWAVFAHVAADVSPRLELEAGVRYTEYETSQVTDYTFGFGFEPPTIPFAAGTQSMKEDSVDYQVALNFDVSERNFLYWLISRGHTTGGINIFPPYRIYDEMEVFNYEFGVKSNFHDDQVRTQTAMFLQKFNNYQVNFESPDIVIGQDNRNAPGTSTIWGIEFSAQSHVGNAHVDGAISYMQSDIGTFENVVDPFRTQANGGVPVLIDLTGRPTPYSPEFTANLGLAYDFLVGSGGEYMLTPRADVSYQSKTQTKLWDSPLVTLERRVLVNARLVLGAPEDRWTATLWATNVFDDGYVAGIQNLATLYYAGRPREYGLTVRYNF
ncbi:MAG: TonB-dependent receptor [Steroidobacteraceae bacterium]